MRRRRWAALCVLLAAAAGRADDRPRDVPDAVKKLLGDEAVQVLQNADRVEVFRAAPGPDPNPKANQDYIDGYRLTAKGKDPGKEFLGRAAATLLDEKTYVGKDLPERFEPAVGLRFWQNQDLVEVLIGFKQGGVDVISKQADGKLVQRTARGLGTSARPALVKLAKQAFPDDKDIQDLTEEKK
jgi:hypothetical protein